MSRLPVMVLLASSLLALTSAALAGSGVGGSSPDRRLGRTVQVSQTSGTLGELLQKLTEAGEVKHSASAFAERPLVALGLKTTIGRVQHATARTFELTWERSKQQPSEYRLVLTGKDRQRRADARARVERQARERLQRRLGEVRRMAALSPDQLRALRKPGDGMVQSLLHPRGAAMTKLLFQLPESAWREFWSTGRARITVGALSPQIQNLARGAMGSDTFSREGGESYRPADLVVPEGVIRLQWGGTIDRPTIWGVLQAGRHSVQNNLLYAEAWARQSPGARRLERRRYPTDVPADPRFRQKVTIKDRPERAKAGAGERPKGAAPFVELLQQLEKQIDMPIVAEAEHRPKEPRWLETQWWLAADIVDRPLSEALDLLCADFEAEWQFSRGMVLVRPTRWYAEPEERGYRYPKPYE